MTPFTDVSTFALKSEHVRFLQDFIFWPKCLETEKSRDRNGQTETVRPKWSDRIGQIEKSRTRQCRQKTGHEWTAS